MDGRFFVAAKLLAVPALFALLLTLLLAPLGLLVYRARVAALMQRGAGGSWGRIDAPAAPAAAPHWQLLDLTHATPPTAAPWRAAARRARGRVALIDALAGLATGGVFAAAFALAYAEQLSSATLVAALIVFALPAAATLLHGRVLSPWRRAAAFAAVLVLAWLAAGLGRSLVPLLFQGFVLLPALVLLVFSLPLWRAVAPLLLPLAGGASLLWVLGTELGRHGGPLLTWTLRLAGFALGAALGLVVLRGLQRRLEGGRLGDDTLFVAAWWLVYVVYTTVLFVLTQHHLAWLVLLLAFAVWLGVRRLAAALLAAPPRVPRTLLLLRVFDQGRRTRRLFARLEQDWRWFGRIALIAGHDLALRSVGAADVVAFVTGRLRQRFVADPATLQQRLAASPAGPDPDGRFPVEHFWCHADTWRPVLRALAARSDLVLMDLRGFGPQHEGYLFELRHLAATARDKPVLVVVSADAELDALRPLLAGDATPGAPWQVARVGRDTTDLAPAVFGLLGARP